MDVSGKKLSADSVAAKDFSQIFENYTNEKGFHPQQVYIIDKTTIYEYFELLTKKTFATRDLNKQGLNN